MLKKQYCLQEEEEEEEEREKEEELRTTTKNNKRFHKQLILKKKDEVIRKFPILSQKNSDLIVSAENKFKELKSIFILKKIYIEKNKQLKEHIYGLELIEHRYRCETDRLNKKKKIKKFLNKMDIVCRILSQFHMINKKEEANLKKKIKDCLYNSKGILIKILYDVKNNDLDLSKIYSTMVVSNFGHIIAFYCLLETYDEYECKTKEEKERIIIQLTLISLNEFSIFKENRLEEEEKKNHFSSIFYQYIKDVGLNYFISSIGGYILS